MEHPKEGARGARMEKYLRVLCLAAYNRSPGVGWGGTAGGTAVMTAAPMMATT